ncbi:ADP-ribosylation factor [Favolaschia claudopus]|uniref:ADP-ribosylation factor n=1 Tax=Favolaschia claudopus TaxID=2862362 RepID=A0AAW0BYQ4_9AGAR
MSFTIFRRLFDRLYPSLPERYKIPLLGLDASGKTTLLYRLKTGEIVTTIPTIGFQVETMEVPAGKGRAITMLCWDAGGCSKLSPFFYRPYTAGSHAMVWVIDSGDPERLTESVEELDHHIRIITSDPEAPMSPQDLPVLILAAKRDLPRIMPLQDIETKVAGVIKDSPYRVVGLSSRADNTTITEAFGWLLDTIEEIRGRKPVQAVPAAEVPNPSSPDALETKLKEWLLRAEKESPPEEILRRFETFSLPAWDHYHHILIAFLLLSIHGRQKGKDMIFDGLERYIANSEQTRGRTFHITMTYFWIQMVHFGMARMPSLEVTSETTDTLSEYTLVAAAGDEDDEKQVSAEEEPLNERFVRFLFTNPHLADGNLWAEYYSKDVMMSPEAKAVMVLPDKKPLPSLVGTKEK